MWIFHHLHTIYVDIGEDVNEHDIPNIMNAVSNGPSGEITFHDFVTVVGKEQNVENVKMKRTR